MNLMVLVVALFGLSINAQAPCTSTICLSNCPLDPRCPAFNPLKAVLLPHSDCSKFYKCHNGRACTFDCPPGLHYNKAKEACDWPEQACCDPRVPCRPDPCNGGTGCAQPPAPQPCPPSSCPPAGPGQCPPIWCPVPPPQPCPPSNCPPTGPGQCPPIWCPAPTPPPPTPAPCPPTNCPPTGPGCPPTWCPQPTPPTPAPCPPIICGPQPPCSGGGNNCNNCIPNSECPLFNPAKPKLLRHNDCTKFYKCETGRACEMTCPPGLHFNLSQQVCDWPWFACCDRTIECRPNPCDTNECPPSTLPPTCIRGWNC